MIAVDSQILVQTDRIEKKISALYPGYGGYVSGSIVVLMFSGQFLYPISCICAVKQQYVNFRQQENTLGDRAGWLSYGTAVRHFG